MRVTRLQKAASRGDLAAVRRLLADGVGVDAPGDVGLTALMLAAKGAHVLVVRALLAAGADVHERATDSASGFAGLTPVHFAVGAVGVRAPAMDRTLAALIRVGADVNAKDRDGWTPLHYAASLARHRLVTTLLAAGANPNARAREGTPLTVLCRAANPRASSWVGVATALVRAGADMTITNRPLCDESPISIAAAAWNTRLLRILQRAAG